MKRSFSYLMLVLAVTLSCSKSNDSEPEIEPYLVVDDPVVPWLEVDHAYLSGSGSEGIGQTTFEIRSDSEWHNLMARMNLHNTNATESFEVTRINFQQYMVIAVFDAVRPSGGYNVEMTDSFELPDRLVINVSTREPGPNEGVTAAINQPYHIIRIPATELRITFQGL